MVEWGPSRAERGVRAFLDDALAPPLPWADRGNVLASLDAWLDEAAPAHALLLGPGGRGKSAVLSRWALTVIERKSAEVVYLPISRRFGTALDRDTFGLLHARLESPAFRPSGVAELRVALANRLEGGRETDEPPLVIILDGIEETIYFHIDTALLGRIGPGIRVVVAAEGNGVDWLSRLGWTEQTAAVFSLPRFIETSIVELCSAVNRRDAAPELPAQLFRLTQGEPLLLRLYLDAEGKDALPPPDLGCLAPGYDGYLEHRLGSRLGSGSFARAIDLLSCALGPLGRCDLERLLQASGERVDFTALAGALAAARPILVEHAGAYAFSHERLRRCLADRLSSEDRLAVDEQYLAYGRETIKALRERRLAPSDVSPYLLEYYRSHLDAHPTQLSETMTLCGPEWLSAWAARPNAFGGFLSDVQAARARAAELSVGACQESARASALVAQVRCVLVEVSVITLAKPAPRARRNAEEDVELEGDDGERARSPVAVPPFGEDSIDFGRVIGDGAERSEALVAIALHLSLADREEVLAWAYRAAQRPRPCGRSLVAIAKAASSPAREAIAREAAGALTDAAEDLFPILDIVRILPDDEARVLLRAAFDRVKELPDVSRDFFTHAADLPESWVGVVWRWTDVLPDGALPTALASLAPRLPPELRSEGLEAALATLLTFSAAGGDSGEVARDLALLAPHLPEPLFRRAMEAAQGIGAAEVRCSNGASAMIPFANRLARIGRGGAALAIARSVSAEDDRFRALATLLPDLEEPDRSHLAEELITKIKAATVGAKAFYLEVGAAGLSKAIEAPTLVDLARSTGRLRTLAVTAAHLDSPAREEVIAEVVRMARRMPESETEQLFALAGHAGDMRMDDASYTFGRLLGYLAENTRDCMFSWWSGIDFKILVPILARAGGDAALLGAARETVAVADWFP